jgi:hypothetical protein
MIRWFLGLLIAVALLMVIRQQLPDIQRYMRIRAM